MMKTKYRYILSFLVLALLAVLLAWKYTFRPSDTSVVAKKADVEIDASKLLQAFETDENAANSLYLDKIVIVSGTVESVSVDTLGISVYLKSGDAMAGILCGFDKENAEASSVRKGMKVKIKGICSGYLMDVIMNKCTLEADIKN